MLCRALSMPKNFRMSRSVFCDVSRVLTCMSSTKDKISFSVCSPFVNQSVSSSLLSLLAALIDLSSAEGVLSRFNTLFMIFNPPNFHLNVFGVENSPVHLLVRDCQLLLPSRKSNSVLPVFEVFLIVNCSKSARPGSPVTSRYL